MLNTMWRLMAVGVSALALTGLAACGDTIAPAIAIGTIFSFFAI